MVVGSDGQDGRLLSKRLHSLGYGVLALNRGALDITSPGAVTALILNERPDEVYFLAAHHHSSEDGCADEGELFRESININATAALNFLDAITNRSPKADFFMHHHALFFRHLKMACKRKIHYSDRKVLMRLPKPQE